MMTEMVATVEYSETKLADEENLMATFLVEECDFFTGTTCSDETMQSIMHITEDLDEFKVRVSELPPSYTCASLEDLLAFLIETDDHVITLVEHLGETDLFEDASDGMDLNTAELRMIAMMEGEVDVLTQRLSIKDDYGARYSSLTELITALKQDNKEFKVLREFFSTSNILEPKVADIDDARLTTLLCMCGQASECVARLKEFAEQGNTFKDVDALIDSLGTGDYGADE